jgi:hypothetical protein
MSDLFDVIDWVLKKKNKEVFSEESTSTFMLNRWLSMSSNDASKVVNTTINRWDGIDFSNVLKFYRIFLPKNNQKIQYIKKENTLKKDDSNEDLEKLCKNMEISKREIEIYDQMIKNLN